MFFRALNLPMMRFIPIIYSSFTQHSFKDPEMQFSRDQKRTSKKSLLLQICESPTCNISTVSPAQTSKWLNYSSRLSMIQRMLLETNLNSSGELADILEYYSMSSSMADRYSTTHVDSRQPDWSLDSFTKDSCDLEMKGSITFDMETSWLWLITNILPNLFNCSSINSCFYEALSCCLREQQGQVSNCWQYWVSCLSIFIVFFIKLDRSFSVAFNSDIIL